MGKVMIVMEMPDKYKQLKSNFLKGEYSLFPEEYMKTYYNNLKQFDIWSKSPELRKELEHKLDVKLDKTAELEEIPKLHEEIFNYNKEIKI